MFNFAVSTLTLFLALFSLKFLPFNSRIFSVFQIISLCIVGFNLRNPIVTTIYTALLLFLPYIVVPVYRRKDVIYNIKLFILSKILLRNMNFLMLLGTAAFFGGLSLPAVREYPIFVLLTMSFFILSKYIVEKNRTKAFEKFINEYENDDKIKALSLASERMLNFYKNSDIEELIKVRLEQIRLQQQTPSR